MECDYMRYSTEGTTSFARNSGLAATAALGVLLSSMSGSAYAQDDPRPEASGTGSGAFVSPSEILTDSTTQDGLKYSVPLPFYQKNGAYVEVAGGSASAQEVGAGTAPTLSMKQSQTTTQTIPMGGGSGAKPTVNSVVGSVLKAALKKAEDTFGIKDPGAAAAIVDTLFELSPKSASNVNTESKSVTFVTSNKLQVKAKRNLTAYPVFYRVKTVSDEWMKNAGSLELTAQNTVSDVVVKSGWLLRCGDKICQPGKDYESKIEVKWPEGGVDFPPMSPPDDFEPGKEKEQNGVRWQATGPASCEAKPTGDPYRDPYTKLPLAVKCPKPDRDNPRAFTHYRFAYHIQGDNPMKCNWFDCWDGNISNGTISFAGYPYRDFYNSTTDVNSMRAQDGLNADNQWKEFRVGAQNLTYDWPHASPKWRVDIIPVS